MLLDSWHAVLSAASAAADPRRAGTGSSSRQPQQPLPRDHPSVPAFNSLSPPPGCPMHKPVGGSSSGSGSMSSSAFKSNSARSSSSSELSFAKAAAAASGPSSSSSASTSRSWSETLNPLNMMPFLSNSRASEKQKAVLPVERTVSSIPRSGGSAPPGASPYDAPAAASSSSASGPAKCPVAHDGPNKRGGGAAGASAEETAAPAAQYWEYPSPQQFYNALVRKGWETPEEHVEMMVLIHNWLNEAAWQEVLEWERLAGVDPTKVELARFQGKPGTLSPKARLYTLLGQVMPSRFQSEPPFDRHDWIVRRPPSPGSPTSTQPTEVRYIIDYYSVPESEQANPDDEPEFVLDIRPALESVGSAWVRVQKTWDEYTAGRGTEAQTHTQTGTGTAQQQRGGQ